MEKVNTIINGIEHDIYDVVQINAGRIWKALCDHKGSDERKNKILQDYKAVKKLGTDIVKLVNKGVLDKSIMNTLGGRTKKSTGYIY